MTFEIALVFAIVAGAVVLFVSEWLRVDIVALLVLLSLALTGLLEPKEALTGFSNPAVITVWAVFIISGGLQRTGVAGLLGRYVMRLAGSREVPLLIAVMVTAGSLSAFMNNVGVAALLLPVVMDIARRTGRPPSKLLIPLAYSSLLGGLTTLIGTPPNLLIADAQRARGLQPFQLFDFTPVGLTVMLAGIGFMAIVGRRLLPDRGGTMSAGALGSGTEADLRKLYGLDESLLRLQVPEDSRLAGKTLRESRLGSALGLFVVGIERRGRMRPAPDSETVIEGGDRLLVEGQAERLAELRGREYLELEDDQLTIEKLASDRIEVAEIVLPPTFLGRTLRQIDVRRRFDFIVLAVLRGERPIAADLETIELQRGDRLLVQGLRSRLDELRGDSDFEVREAQPADSYGLAGRLLVVGIPEDSPLDGKTLIQSRIGSSFGLAVLGIGRDGENRLMPSPDEVLRAGDTLYVKGRPEDLQAVEGLRSLEVQETAEADLDELESEEVGLTEVVLSPRTSLAGKTLREVHFREKFGLTVVAISSQGKVLRSQLRRRPLRFGDALLLYGPRRRLKVLGSEHDFLVLTEEAQEPVRESKAPIAALIMAAVLVPVVLGWLPIYIAAVGGATLMVLSRCLSMDEAYRFIEWRAVFLIAGMLPLGLALEQTGAASFVTGKVVELVGGFGPLALVAALYGVTAVAAQMMPTAAVAILMAPIALNTALSLGLSPSALLMTISLSASASFLSPVAHPANTLIMGPGGYRFVDYIKVGAPLTLFCLIVVLVVLPLVWPLTP